MTSSRRRAAAAALLLAGAASVAGMATAGYRQIFPQRSEDERI